MLFRSKNATFDYKLKNNKLITSKHFSYKIEKITKDSLVISEEMKGLEIGRASCRERV